MSSIGENPAINTEEKVSICVVAVRAPSDPHFDPDPPPAVDAPGGERLPRNLFLPLASI